MADYNIYIHFGGYSNTGNSPTQPWRNNSGGGQMQAWGNQQEQAQEDDNIDSVKELVSKGNSLLKKTFPKVAAAFVAVKVGEKLVESAVDYSALFTGDYRASHTIDNYKAMMHAMVHPFSTTINIIKTNMLNNIENQKRREYRELLGDSIINSYTNRGV